MSQVLKLHIAGLYTHPNTLSEIPEGALQIAENIVIDRESIAESRRGFKQYGSPATATHKLFSYLGKLIKHYGSKLAYDNGSGTFTDLTGTVDGPGTDLRVKSTVANSNLYLATDTGIQRMDSVSSDPRRAGVPRACDLTVVAGAAGQASPDDTQTAYRVLFGYRDANKNLILGAPSPRAIFTNSSGGDLKVDLNFSIPTGVTNALGYFYQIYRSFPSVSAVTPPDDELQLVAEIIVPAIPPTAGEITYTDNTPFELLGAALYTNSTQEGILQANDRPPYAMDLTTYKNFTFYFNTKQPQRAIVYGLELPALNDTITIDGVVFTAKATETITSKEFKLYSTGDLAVDVPATIISLCRVVNRQVTPTVELSYIGGTAFLAERVDYGASFTVLSSNAAVFGKTYTSDNEVAINGVSVSKALRPDAVPTTNTLRIGRADKAILRGIALRDMIVVLKEDGIFRITGDDLTNFSQEAHDTTYVPIGPECATKLSNHVFCTSDQGVIAISPSGVTVSSRPIEKDLLKIIELSNFSKYAWAVGYDSDRKFILGVPGADSSSDVEVLYVYNFMTNSWTTWQIAATNGVVHDADDQLYLIRVIDAQTLQERKDYELSDYADDDFAVNITSSSGEFVTLTSVADVEIGMTLVQGAEKAIVTDINGSILTTDSPEATWTPGAATVYTPIHNRIRWTEEHAGNPGLVKLWSEITFFFESARFKNITFKAGTNFTSGLISTPLQSIALNRWGRFARGRVAWGSGFGGFQPIRTYFPREAARAMWANMEIELNEAFTAFGLAGASYVVEPMSTRFK